MIELTDRERKLLDIIKKLITFTTILGIFQQRSTDLAKWTYNSLDYAGMSLEWQNSVLKELEKDFGIKYVKLNPDTLEEAKETTDGNQTA